MYHVVYQTNRCTRCNCYIWCNCCTSVTFVNSAPTVPKTQEPPPADGGEPSKFLEMFDFVDLIFKMLLMIPIWDQKMIKKNRGLLYVLMTNMATDDLNVVGSDQR